MTKLEQLLAQYCPNGVEYIQLNTICEIYDGTHQTPQYTDSGVKFVSVENIGALYETTKYISKEAYGKYKIKPQLNDVLMTRIGSIGVCTVVDRTEDLAYYVSLALLRPNQNVLNSKYLKYVIESKHGRKELYKRTLLNAVPIKVNMGDIGKIIIPVPPLSVQEEIVRILDELTEKTDKLISELTAELDERKKQYEYYKRQILLFDNPNTQWVTLGDIGKVSMCKRIMKSETSPNGDIPFYKIGTFGCQANAYISKETFEAYKEKYSYPKKGDILISAAGTIGRTVIFDGQPAYFQDSNIVWIANEESKVLNCFLSYYYQTQPWQISTGGTISRLYNDNISSAKIPLISKEEQLKIVSIIEKCETVFSNYTNSIKEEITARKQQYEYYRNKLLTF